MGRQARNNSGLSAQCLRNRSKQRRREAHILTNWREIGHRVKHKHTHTRMHACMQAGHPSYLCPVASSWMVAILFGLPHPVAMHASASADRFHVNTIFLAEGDNTSPSEPRNSVSAVLSTPSTGCSMRTITVSLRGLPGVPSFTRPLIVSSPCLLRYGLFGCCGTSWSPVVEPFSVFTLRSIPQTHTHNTCFQDSRPCSPQTTSRTAHFRSYGCLAGEQCKHLLHSAQMQT
jgi:hypothetical protein